MGDVVPGAMATIALWSSVAEGAVVVLITERGATAAIALRPSVCHRSFPMIRRLRVRVDG